MQTGCPHCLHLIRPDHCYHKTLVLLSCPLKNYCQFKSLVSFNKHRHTKLSFTQRSQLKIQQKYMKHFQIITKITFNKALNKKLFTQKVFLWTEGVIFYMFAAVMLNFLWVVFSFIQTKLYLDAKKIEHKCILE